jgi:hypothetical protein
MILEYSFSPKYEIEGKTTDELIERLQDYVHHFEAFKKLKNLKFIINEVGYFVWRIETDDPVEIKKAVENCFLEVDENGIPIEEKVANKVRADLKKEKLSNELKAQITDDTIVINQKNKPYIRISNEDLAHAKINQTSKHYKDLPKAFEWDHPDRGRYYIPKGEWVPKLKKE